MNHRDEEEEIKRTLEALERGEDVNVMIVDDNGMPSGFMDIGKLQSDATQFMYEMAASAGNDDKTTAIGEAWAKKCPDSFGFMCAFAVKHMVTSVLSPILEVTDALGVDLRKGLVNVRDGRPAGAE